MLHNRGIKSCPSKNGQHDKANGREPLPMPRILTSMARQRAGVSGDSAMPSRRTGLPQGSIAQSASAAQSTLPDHAQPSTDVRPAIETPTVPISQDLPSLKARDDSDLRPEAAAAVHLQIKPINLEPLSPVSPRHRPADKRWVVRPALLAITMGAVLFIGFTQGGRYTRTARPLMSQIDNLAELAGLGISQVSLQGHRYTADGDIFDALQLSTHRSMLSFSITDARARLEALPWVKKANVLRRLPDQLMVEIAEREPFAVWRADGKHRLIDDTGRVLAVIKVDGADHLPLVIGAGAATRAKDLFTTIKAYRAIAARLVAIERVGGRRWTLWFAGGVRSDLAVHLPQENHKTAIARLDHLNRTASVFDRALTAIDLRNSGRVTLRSIPAQHPGQVNSPIENSPGRT